MEADRLVAALERFFLDIVGSLIPGTLLLVGLYHVAGATAAESMAGWIPDSASSWAVAVAVAYVLGQGVASVGEVVVSPVSVSISKRIRRAAYDGPVLSRKDLFSQIAQSYAAREFIREFNLRGGDGSRASIPTPGSFYEYRNVAMSMSSAEDRATAVRFMFLSLLNLGTATTLWILALAVGCGIIIEDIPLWPPLRPVADYASAVVVSAIPVVAAFAVGVLLSLPFLQRRFYFYRISSSLPFATAIAAIRNTSSLAVSSPRKDRSVMTVYLAGGFRSGWQDIVKQRFPDLSFFDPREHSLEEAGAYTSWDLAAIRECDLLFGYLERTNPGGYALALEIGYAAALDKHTMLIDEKGLGEDASAPFLKMLHATVHYATPSLEEGLHYLRQYVRIQSRDKHT